MGTKPDAAAQTAAEQARRNEQFNDRQWKTSAEREAAKAAYDRVKAEQNKKK